MDLSLVGAVAVDMMLRDDVVSGELDYVRVRLIFGSVIGRLESTGRRK